MNKIGFVKAIESLSAMVFIALLLYYGFNPTDYSFNPEGLKIATSAMMASQAFLIIVAILLKVKLSFSQKAIFVVTFVLGSLTVFLSNPIFFKLKGTIVNVFLAFLLGVSHLWQGQTIVEWVFENSFKDKGLVIPKNVLLSVSYWCIAYFFFTGCLNFYVATNFSDKVWTIYKYAVGLGINFCFILFIVYKLKDYLAPLLEEKDKKQ